MSIKAVSVWSSFKSHISLNSCALTRLNYCYKSHLSDKVNLWKIIFYGTDNFSEVSLRLLNSNRLKTCDSRVVQDIDVVCSKANCEVRRCAKALGLKIYSWPFNVPSNMYDVGVVVSFGHMIPSESILACKYGFINAHPSLLPRWRGASPIVHTILHGDTETGVTITQVSHNKFDVGNIIVQEKCAIPPNSSSKSLTSELSHIASELVLKTLENLPLSIKSSFPQPKEGATYARKIKFEHGLIDWDNSTALNIDRKFRAYQGTIKLFTYWKSLKVSLLEHVSPKEVCESKISTLVQRNVSPGFCYFHKRRKILFIKCEDEWAGITRLKIPKKGNITAQDFYNGFLSKVDISNCYFHSSCLK